MIWIQRVDMNNFFLAVLVILLTTYSQLILRLRFHNKMALSSVRDLNFSYFLSIFTDVWVCSSIVAFSLSFVCWALALSNNINVTKTYPIVTVLTIFFVSLSNLVFFQDKINAPNIIGAILIFLGIFLLLR